MVLIYILLWMIIRIMTI